MNSKTERRMSAELKKELINIKDCEDFNTIDFDKIEMSRGETPADIKEKCFQLCKDYLSGNWLKQTVDTIDVKRISGGMTNQLYYCGITKPSAAEETPQEVAIRLYGPKYFNNTECDGNERLTDIVIALMVSKNGLGPKIYGLFEDGQIQAFYKHRQFKLEEQKVPTLVNELFEKLARVHAMDVPIKKTHWLLKEVDRFYDISIQKFPSKELLSELNCETLLKHDLKPEIEFAKGLVLKSGSPMVFTHNDFRSANIMVLEDNINNNNDNENQNIVLCDFEYSSYGYRAHDFSTIISEWGRSMNDFKDVHNFPDDQTLKGLIEIYVRESEKIFGKQYTENPINSLDHILREIKIFSLMTQLFLIMFCLKEEGDGIPLSEKVKLQICETCYKNYWHLKSHFAKEKLF